LLGVEGGVPDDVMLVVEVVRVVDGLAEGEMGADGGDEAEGGRALADGMALPRGRMGTPLEY